MGLRRTLRWTRTYTTGYVKAGRYSVFYNILGVLWRGLCFYYSLFIVFIVLFVFIVFYCFLLCWLDVASSDDFWDREEYYVLHHDMDDTINRSS